MPCSRTIALAALALAARHDGLDEKIDAVSAKLRENPREAALLLERADLLRRHEEWESARNDLFRAQFLNPWVKEIEYQRGLLFLDAGRPEAAVAELDRFLSDEPLHAPAILARARAHTLLGEEAAAAEDYGLAISCQERPRPDHFLERAVLLASSGPEGERRALACLDDGLRELGSVPALAQAALDALIRMGRLDEALSRLRTLEAAANRKERWLAREGDLLYQLGRVSEARGAWARCRKAIRDLPVKYQRTTAVLELLQHADERLFETAP